MITSVKKLDSEVGEDGQNASLVETSSRADQAKFSSRLHRSQYNLPKFKRKSNYNLGMNCLKPA